MSRFRNRDRSNRQGRGQIEHNVLEGLPINQYREIEVTIGPNAADNKPIDVNAWPELPMPRDSHMLPEHSQQLLRAARSGRTIQPPAPPEDDDNELKDEETEQKQVSVGFTVKKYVKVARHNEAPEPEYLAKRRKGLPSQYMNGQVQAPLRETKVKKLDAEGNVAVYKVLAPEGQAVEGEVAPTDAAIEVAPVIAAPGTVVEGVGVVNAEGIVVANDILQQTPPRRRPPPPKKKKMKHIPRPGPGRGRKRVDFVEGAEGQGTPAPGADGVVPAIRDLKEGEGGSVEPSDRDTPMGDAGEDEESGEEGSEDEEQEQDQEDGTPVTPSKAPTPASAAPTSAPVVEMTDAPSIVEPTESAIVTAESTTIPLEILQTPVEAVPPTLTSVPRPVEPVEPIEPVEPVELAEPAEPAEPREPREPREPIEPTEATEATEPAVTTTIQDRSSPPELPLHSRQVSIPQLPTSAITIEPSASEVAPAEPASAAPAPSEPVPVEPIASEPIPAPVPSTETDPVPASVDIPAGEPADESVSAPVPEPTTALSQQQPPAASAGNTPDLLGSLEAELDKE